MNSKNSKTSEPRRLVLSRTDKEVINRLLYQIIVCTIHGKA